jgi:hypothetical protein
MNLIGALAPSFDLTIAELEIFVELYESGPE